MPLLGPAGWTEDQDAVGDTPSDTARTCYANRSRAG